MKKYLNLFLLLVLFGWVILPGYNVVNTDKLVMFSKGGSDVIDFTVTQGDDYSIQFGTSRARDKAYNILLAAVTTPTPTPQATPDEDQP